MRINGSEADVVPADGALTSAGRRCWWLPTLLVGVGLDQLDRLFPPPFGKVPLDVP